MPVPVPSRVLPPLPRPPGPCGWRGTLLALVLCVFAAHHAHGSDAALEAALSTDNGRVGAIAPVPAEPTALSDLDPSSAALPMAAPVLDLPVRPGRDLTEAPTSLWTRIRDGFAMPDLSTSAVRAEEDFYANRPDHLRRVAERSRRYLFHVVEAVERRGMPSELALLPIIESAVNPVAVSKMGETFTLLPRIAYKRGGLEVEGKVAYSDSTSWYDPLGRRNSIRDTNSPTASNVTFRAQRSSPTSVDWQFTQIAGPDIASGASFTNPSVTVNDGRFGRTILLSGEVNATLKTLKALPIIWKSGVKTRQQIQKFEDDQLAKRFDYVGGPATGAWAPYRSPWEYDLGMIGGSIRSSSGANVFMPNLRALADLYAAKPGDFRQNWGTNADNFYESYVARRRRYYERIDAGFLMGTTSLKGLTARAGLRWEETTTQANEADTRTPAELRVAGFPVNAAGRATTIPGIQYQFLSQPRVNRTGSYDNLFPSASLKYSPRRNLDLHFGYSSTIRRPSYVNLSGVWIVNDTALTVTAPNPRLKPETSDNYAARVAYYFEPVGQLAVTFTERRVENLFITDRLSAEEFGYAGDPEFGNYEFITFENGTGRIRIRSMELEYNQSLAALGPLFRRLSVRAAYTRLYAEIPRANLTPHLASGGLNYTYNRLNVYANWNWSDDVNTNVAGTTYRRHRTNVDAGGGWRLNNTYSLSVSIRNVLNTPYINMQRFATGPTALTRHETVGQSWTFALKGNF